MSNSRTYPDTVHKAERETIDATQNQDRADEHRTPLSSYFGIAIVVALLGAMMFLQAQAATLF